MTDLLTQQCEKITSQSKPLGHSEVDELMQQFQSWIIIDSGGDPHLRRTFEFPTFTRAAQFAFEIGKRADQHNHHPESVGKRIHGTLQISLQQPVEELLLEVAPP